MTKESIEHRTRALEARVRELEDENEELRRQIAGGRRELAAEHEHTLELEELGSFASHIAHDFNNLLVGILGNAGLALMDLSPFSPCRPLIQEVEQAAQRAAELASRMLARSERVIRQGTAPAADGGFEGEGAILVVDDEEMVRTLAGRILRKFGFQVMVAEDGRRALEVFRAHAGEIRAVLLDATMSDVGGEEAFREIRRIDPDARVILSSGYDLEETRQRLAAEGLAGFIHKPYLPEQLIQSVRSALG